ncbi:MAG TPA: hypothetical protein V6C81_23620 [Planktothrix sp.]|jgi:hypothetical protein
MKNLRLVALAASVFLAAPALAQTKLNSVSGPGPTFAYPGMTYQSGNGVYYRGATGYPYSYQQPYGFGYPGYNYGVPTVTPNGLYNFGLGKQAINMWRAPSGYYYPWYGMPAGYSQTTILYAPTTSTTPTVQQPPISTTASDMLKFIDEAHGKKEISDGDYEHLRRRVTDLQSKYRDLFSQSNGNVDPQDEQQIRTDLQSAGMEIQGRVHPQ